MTTPIKWGSGIPVNTTTESTQDQPKIEALANGRFVAAWRDISATGGDTLGAGGPRADVQRRRLEIRRRVRCQHRDGQRSVRAGHHRAVRRPVPDHVEGLLRRRHGPAGHVAVRHRGPAVDANGGRRGRRIPGQHHDLRGTEHAGGRCLRQRPLRAVLDRLQCHRRHRAGGHSRAALRGQREQVRRRVPGQQHHGGNQVYPSVAVLADGNFVAAWTDTAATAAIRRASAVRARLFTSNGTPHGPDFVFYTTTQASSSTQRRRPHGRTLRGGLDGFSQDLRRHGRATRCAPRCSIPTEAAPAPSFSSIRRRRTIRSPRSSRLAGRPLRCRVAEYRRRPRLRSMARSSTSTDRSPARNSPSTRTTSPTCIRRHSRPCLTAALSFRSLTRTTDPTSASTPRSSTRAKGRSTSPGRALDDQYVGTRFDDVIARRRRHRPAVGRATAMTPWSAGPAGTLSTAARASIPRAMPTRRPAWSSSLRLLQGRATPRANAGQCREFCIGSIHDDALLGDGKRQVPVRPRRSRYAQGRRRQRHPGRRLGDESRRRRGDDTAVSARGFRPDYHRGRDGVDLGVAGPDRQPTSSAGHRASAVRRRHDRPSTTATRCSTRSTIMQQQSRRVSRRRRTRSSTSTRSAGTRGAIRTRSSTPRAISRSTRTSRRPASIRSTTITQTGWQRGARSVGPDFDTTLYLHAQSGRRGGRHRSARALSRSSAWPRAARPTRRSGNDRRRLRRAILPVAQSGRGGGRRRSARRTSTRSAGTKGAIRTRWFDTAGLSRALRRRRGRRRQSAASTTSSSAGRKAAIRRRIRHARLSRGQSRRRGGRQSIRSTTSCSSASTRAAPPSPEDGYEPDARRSGAGWTSGAHERVDHPVGRDAEGPRDGSIVRHGQADATRRVAQR